MVFDIYVKVDKGNTIVVIKKESYQTKIHYFIQNDNFTILDKNYTHKYWKDIETLLIHVPQSFQRAQNGT